MPLTVFSKHAPDEYELKQNFQTQKWSFYHFLEFHWPLSMHVSTSEKSQANFLAYLKKYNAVKHPSSNSDSVLCFQTFSLLLFLFLKSWSRWGTENFSFKQNIVSFTNPVSVIKSHQYLKHLYYPTIAAWDFIIVF